MRLALDDRSSTARRSTSGTVAQVMAGAIGHVEQVVDDLLGARAVERALQGLEVGRDVLARHDDLAVIPAVRELHGLQRLRQCRQLGVQSLPLRVTSCDAAPSDARQHAVAVELDLEDPVAGSSRRSSTSTASSAAGLGQLARFAPAAAAVRRRRGAGAGAARRRPVGQGCTLSGISSTTLNSWPGGTSSRSLISSQGPARPRRGPSCAPASSAVQLVAAQLELELAVAIALVRISSGIQVPLSQMITLPAP
jgi:stage V sporulation protein SpoVS